MTLLTIKYRLWPKFHTFFLASIILSLLYLATLCFRWTLADILLTQVDFLLETVDTHSTNKTSYDWRQAQSQLTESMQLRPTSTRALETAESFYQMLDSLEADAPALITELGWKGNETKALDFARAGLALKPTWPYLWKQLIFSKLGLKQYDDELSGAFEKVINLGLHQNYVAYEIAALGIADWEHLNHHSRLAVMQALDYFILINKENKLDETYILNFIHAENICIVKNRDSLLEFAVLMRYCQSLQTIHK